MRPWSGLLATAGRGATLEQDRRRSRCPPGPRSSMWLPAADVKDGSVWCYERSARPELRESSVIGAFGCHFRRHLRIAHSHSMLA